MDIGTRVYVVTDPKHVGTVERVSDDMIWVRWHKGFASWELPHMLRVAEASN
jgi:hypothetical protein